MNKLAVKVSMNLIGVTNLKKAKQFYEQVFNMKFIEFRPPFAEATLGNAVFNIEEHTSYREKNWAKKHIGGRKSCVFQTNNLQQFLKRAIQAKAKIIQKPITRHWGWQDAVIADFDGNEFAIEQEIK